MTYTSTKHPQVPAAFINTIREEGTKKEACDFLQAQWNETFAQLNEITRLRKELRRLETYFNIDAEEYAALPSDYHRVDNDRQLILIRKALETKP
jgi:hypothetical protein